MRVPPGERGLQYGSREKIFTVEGKDKVPGTNTERIK